MPLLQITEVRVSDIVRGVVGASEFFTPQAETSWPGSAPSATEQTIVRVIGARQIAQAKVASAGALRGLGEVLDILHAVTMVVVLIAGPRRWRRPALLQLVVTAGLLGASLRGR